VESKTYVLKVEVSSPIQDFLIDVIRRLLSICEGKGVSLSSEIVEVEKE